MASNEISTVMVKSAELSFSARLKKDFLKNKYIYLLALPVVVFYILFHYVPMYGVIIAFKKYSPMLGIMGSPWIGFKNFESFFESYYLWRLLKNTLLINVYDLLWGFPAPILLALLINEIKLLRFKKIVQTVSYLPYFVSLVVICGLIRQFCTTDGFINDIIVALGGERSDLLGKTELFRTIFVGSNIWQGVGFGTIIYLAAISGINTELYDAAYVDGAGRFRQVLHITIPGILSTVMILLILRIGGMLSVGFEKVILLYSPVIYETSDVISTFVYRKGLIESNYSYSTAVGLFNSVINFILLVGANKISRKYSDSSLW